MSSQLRPALTAQGLPLDMSPAAFGTLRASDDALDDPAELHRRLEATGYLYLPGLLDRDEVLATRRDVLDRLAATMPGALAPDTDTADGVPGPEPATQVLADLARSSAALQTLLYRGRLPALYQKLFGEQVRHLDFTWLRAVYPGPGTLPHGDSVFMNRGTPRLMTAWIPLGDVCFDLGGLMILETSHRLEDVRRDYGSRDVDTYCDTDDADERGWSGYLSENPVELRREHGLRWLTAEFSAGDVLTFTLDTLHASLDNTSSRLRLSCDVRYQRASEPADPRWVGVEPIGHGPQSKQAMIC